MVFVSCLGSSSSGTLRSAKLGRWKKDFPEAPGEQEKVPVTAQREGMWLGPLAARGPKSGVERLSGLRGYEGLACEGCTAWSLLSLGRKEGFLAT